MRSRKRRVEEEVLRGVERETSGTEGCEGNGGERVLPRERERIRREGRERSKIWNDIRSEKREKVKE